MKGIAEILRGKPSQVVHSIGPNDTVYDAIRKMAEHNIGALLVMEGETIVGIVTERDYARKLVLAGRSSKRNAGVRRHDHARCFRRPAADDRGVHGHHDREPRAPSPGARQRQAGRPRFDRRPREGQSFPSSSSSSNNSSSTSPAVAELSFGTQRIALQLAVKASRFLYCTDFENVEPVLQRPPTRGLPLPRSTVVHALRCSRSGHEQDHDAGRLPEHRARPTLLPEGIPTRRR